MNGYWGRSDPGPMNLGPSRPRKLKIWAPSGESTERTGYLALRTLVEGGDLMGLFIAGVHQNDPRGWEEFKPLCVVQDMATKEIMYHPRMELNLPDPLVLVTRRMKKWLDDHPAWPRELELENCPVMCDGELPPYDDEPPSEGLK